MKSTANNSMQAEQPLRVCQLMLVRYEDKILRSLVAVVKTTEQIGPDEYIPRSIVKILEEGTTIEELIDWYSRKFPLSIEISGIEITEAS